MTKIRKIRCICGWLATVDEWNNRGVMVYCPECGAYDIKRDDLYHMALMQKMMLVFIERYRKIYAADAKNDDIEDADYRNACSMFVDMIDEMRRSRESLEEDWKNTALEEIDLY